MSSPFNFGKAHLNGTSGKTQIKQSAIDSMSKQVSTQLGTERFSPKTPQNNFTAIPRTSNPNQFRIVGTHLAGGDPKKGPTSFPVDPKKVPPLILKQFTTSFPGKTIVDAPNSPRLSLGPPSPRKAIK